MGEVYHAGHSARTMTNPSIRQCRLRLRLRRGSSARCWPRRSWWRPPARATAVSRLPTGSTPT